jgi:hypothetical protein
MKFTDALKREIKNLEEKESNTIPFLREDFTDLMICVRFADGKFHFLLPDKKIIEEFLKELNGVSRNGLWWKLKENYKEQKLEPLIEEGEFKVE